MNIVGRMSAVLTAALMCSALFTACGESGAAETAENESAQASMTETEEQALDSHTALVKSSLVSLGNTCRIKEKLAAMERGEDVAVAYLGGSITYGYTVNPDECWAKLTYDYLCEKYPSSSIDYVNAGLSGTPSILGNLRVRRDVLDYNADIVFIEYAVNDGNDKLYQESYDSLVKTVLEQENSPAVILLFNRTKEGHTAQDYMKQIGEYYDLPMISTADALTPALESGEILWEDYYNDSSHPSPEGHKLFTEFIVNYFDELEEAEADGEYSVPLVGKFGAPYENAVMIEADYDNSDSGIAVESLGGFDKSANGVSGFNKGWAYNKDSDGEPLKFTVTGNSLFLVCNRNNSSGMGKIEVYIDGTRAKVIDLNDPDGWGDPNAYQVIKWQSVKTMNVEIKIAEGSEDKITEILAIGYSANETLM
ncbi:MAG: SGNH/GDSL hydrolase family protein [Oscillospiraceae bacterium]|nr:SGNH/GDSL hydrolase family protein [Oscillospiraceae bacterium]